MVVEGQFLLSVGRVIGVSEVEHDGRRGLWVAGNEVGHQRLGEPREVLAVHAVFKAREGGRTRQVLRWRQGRPLHAELKQGVMTEAVGIIAVRIAGGDLRDTLGEEVAQGVVNIGRRRLSCMAAARRAVRPIWRSMPRSKRTPKSEDKAPPSKSARTV